MIRAECLTGSFAVKVRAADGFHDLTMRFEFAAVNDKGTLAVRCGLPNGIQLTLDLGGDDEVRIRESGALQRFLKRGWPDAVFALEQYLRWCEESMLWAEPAVPQDGPFSNHPDLADLPRAQRDRLAKLIAEGRRTSAIKMLRVSTPGLGLATALDMVNGLQYWLV